MAALAPDTHEVLNSVSAGDIGTLERGIGVREAVREHSGWTRGPSRSSRSRR